MLTILAILAIVLLFSLTIFIHELGHFLVARLCGMKVEVFSIGFGPPLWKRVRNGITYKIGAFPFGGYVALPQMNPSPIETGAEPTEPLPPLPPAAPWKRILVSLAGATGNIILGVLLAWLVFAFGKPSAPHERRCVIGYVEPGSGAWEAGLQLGDTVVAIDGTPVQNWQDLLTHLALGNNEEATFLVRSGKDDTARELRLALEQGRMGLRLPEGVAMESLCRIQRTVPGSSAEAAGLASGDLITSLDGIRVYSIPHLIDLVQERVEMDIPITVRRGRKTVTLTVRPVPDPDDGVPRIGIRFDDRAVDFDQVIHPRPLAQIREHATLILRILRALVTPNESRGAARALGGPVAIFYHLWLIRNSLMLAVSFTVLLNINLAILNLLPIPVLDGGHILFAVSEMIIRRPLPPKAVEWLHRIFVSLLISVFLLLMFRDTLRLFF